MTADEECVGYARECLRLPDCALIRRFGISFFRWGATGWPKPCTSPARMRLR